MSWMKRCHECSGTLYEDRDRYGAFIACLHCGYYMTEAEEVLLRY